jgi:hypothetical protein
MKTQIDSATTLAPQGAESCHGGSRGRATWFARNRVWLIAGLATAAGAGFALSQDWIAVANLVPLLFTLPCAAMMFMCMKGMRQGQRGGDKQSSR